MLLSVTLAYFRTVGCNRQYSCLFLPQTTSSALKGAIQLGIGYTVGNLSSKPERDVLMQDFYVVESIFFPRFVSIFTPEAQRQDTGKKGQETAIYGIQYNNIHIYNIIYKLHLHISLMTSTERQENKLN